MILIFLLIFRGPYFLILFLFLVTPGNQRIQWEKAIWNKACNPMWQFSAQWWVFKLNGNRQIYSSYGPKLNSNHSWTNSELATDHRTKKKSILRALITIFFYPKLFNYFFIKNYLFTFLQKLWRKLCNRWQETLNWLLLKCDRTKIPTPSRKCLIECIKSPMNKLTFTLAAPKCQI